MKYLLPCLIVFIIGCAKPICPTKTIWTGEKCENVEEVKKRLTALPIRKQNIAGAIIDVRLANLNSYVVNAKPCKRAQRLISKNVYSEIDSTRILVSSIDFNYDVFCRRRNDGKAFCASLTPGLAFYNNQYATAIISDINLLTSIKQVDSRNNTLVSCGYGVCSDNNSGSETDEKVIDARRLADLASVPLKYEKIDSSQGSLF